MKAAEIAKKRSKEQIRAGIQARVDTIENMCEYIMERCDDIEDLITALHLRELGNKDE